MTEEEYLERKESEEKLMGLRFECVAACVY